MKVIFILVYACYIIFVPAPPNLYTIIVNCVGFTAAIFSSSLLLNFLNTRPVAQKNFMNRILALGTTVHICRISKHFVFSLIVFSWETETNKLVKAHLTPVVALLSERYYTILETSLLCALSSGRLLLFIKPVMFQNIHPTTGGIIASATAIGVTILDFLFGWMTCRHSSQSNLIKNFKDEFGLHEVFDGFIDESKRIFSPEDRNTSYEASIHLLEGKNFSSESQHNTSSSCSPYFSFPTDVPTVIIMTSIFIVLELAKPIYVCRQEYMKMKKARKVDPEMGISQFKKNSTRRTRTQPVYQRSNSMPLNTKKVNLRRFSLQSSPYQTEINRTMGQPVENVSPTGISETLGKSKANAPFVKALQIKPSPNIATHIPNVLRKLLLRTSSLLTLFVLVGISIYIFIYFLVPNSSWRTVIQLTLTRFNIYVLLVLVVVFDKDVLAYLSDMLHF